MSRVASPAKVQYGVVVIFDKVITGFRIALEERRRYLESLQI